MLKHIANINQLRKLSFLLQVSGILDPSLDPPLSPAGPELTLGQLGNELIAEKGFM